MNETQWSGGDAVTHALLCLASDRRLPADTVVGGELLTLARVHGLTSILAGEVDVRAVKAVHGRQRARQKVMEAHLHRILEKFDIAGLRVAVMKGPKVAEAYPTPGLRPYSDIDLLVQEQDLDRAIGLMAEDEAVVEIPVKRPKAAKRDVVLGDSTGVRFNLDLHWDLFSYSQLRGGARGAMDEAWSLATRADESILGPHWDLPLGHVAGFLTAHAVLDHRFRLILFRDLLELARNRPDWGEIIGTATRWNLRSTSYLAWFIANGAAGAPIPEDVLTELRPRSAAISFLERRIPRLDLARFDGHTSHPVNLASVLLHDSRRERFSLLMRAPKAFPRWRQRVSEPEEPGNSPKVLIVVSTDRRRGAEVFTERLREGLSARGWVVDAVGLKGAGETPRADFEALVAAGEDSGRRFQWSVFRALRRQVRTYQPDLIVANGGATLRYSVIARVGTGAKLAYMSIGEPRYWIRSGLSRFLNRMMLRRTDLVIAVAEETRRQLIELEPKVEQKSHSLYTGLEVSRYRSSDPRPESEELRVLMVGSLTDEKDPLLALDAVARVPEAVLRYVGSGPLRDELSARAASMGMSERVEFVGSVSDVTPHFEWGDVLLLTSKTEGLPGATLEASAAGLAIVAVDVGGVREAVIDGETGYVTDRDDEALSTRLRELKSDRNLLLTMGHRGHMYVREQFRIDKVIEDYRNALRDLVQ